MERKMRRFFDSTKYRTANGARAQYKLIKAIEIEISV